MLFLLKKTFFFLISNDNTGTQCSSPLNLFIVVAEFCDVDNGTTPPVPARPRLCPSKRALNDVPLPLRVRI